MKTFICWCCGNKLGYDHKTAGKDALCPRCMNSVQIPEEYPVIALDVRKSPAYRRQKKNRITFAILIIIVMLFMVVPIIIQITRVDHVRHSYDLEYSTLTDEIESNSKKLDENYQTAKPLFNADYMKALQSAQQYNQKRLQQIKSEYQKQYGTNPVYIKPSDR